jgi:primary-amine oxidase
MVQMAHSLPAMMSSTSLGKTLTAHAHPLDPLTAAEIRATVSAVRSHIAKSPEAPKPIERALFNSISLREPAKYAVLEWSGLFSKKDLVAAGAKENGKLLRQADVSCSFRGW